jgi:hypothetical protein
MGNSSEIGNPIFALCTLEAAHEGHRSNMKQRQNTRSQRQNNSKKHVNNNTITITYKMASNCFCFPILPKTAMECSVCAGKLALVPVQGAAAGVLLPGAAAGCCLGCSFRVALSEWGLNAPYASTQVTELCNVYEFPVAQTDGTKIIPHHMSIPSLPKQTQ